jgi:hypothetical protein
MYSTWATKAAKNNADLCDCICRSHGVPGEFHGHMWANRRSVPPFYPNAVTLDDSKPIEQYQMIRELTNIGIPGRWAVKDSFETLDLTSEGFRELFTRQWIYLPGTSKLREAHHEAVRWEKVKDAKELIDWEHAWRGNNPEGKRIFLPPLLEDHRVIIVAVFREDSIVAGCIGNRSNESVGISNIFLPNEKSEELRAGCVTAIVDWSQGLPVVGYESGEDLIAMEALGFESVGPLRVWIETDSCV